MFFPQCLLARSTIWRGTRHGTRATADLCELRGELRPRPAQYPPPALLYAAPLSGGQQADPALAASAAQGACNSPQGSLPIPAGAALQDVMGSPLQEILAAQPYVLIGLISHLWDCALQEEIVCAGTRLLQLGRDICGGDHDRSRSES